MRGSVLLTAGLTILALNACDAQRDDTGAIETAGDVSVFTIQVGDCFDDQDGTEVQRVGGVPCTEPHDNQVYATFDLAEGDFPGEERVEELAGAGCRERFEAAIGASPEDSELVSYPMTPTRGSWNDRDDREVVCVAYQRDQDKLTGSVLGSGR